MSDSKAVEPIYNLEGCFREFSNRWGLNAQPGLRDWSLHDYSNNSDWFRYCHDSFMTRFPFLQFHPRSLMVDFGLLSIFYILDSFKL